MLVATLAKSQLFNACVRQRIYFTSFLSYNLSALSRRLVAYGGWRLSAASHLDFPLVLSIGPSVSIQLLTTILCFVDVIPASHPVVPWVILWPPPESSHHKKCVVECRLDLRALNHGSSCRNEASPAADGGRQSRGIEPQKSCVVLTVRRFNGQEVLRGHQLSICTYLCE